jgi:hypothetical protein
MYLNCRANDCLSKPIHFLSLFARSTGDYAIRPRRKLTNSKL